MVGFYGSPSTAQGKVSIGPDGNVITGTVQPNAGSFAWTTNDMKSVKDIVTWVKVAIDAAKSASSHADYIDNAIQHIDAQKGAIDNKLTDATTLVTQVTALQSTVKTDVQKLIDDATKKLVDVKHYHDAAFTAMDFIVVLYDALAAQFPQLPAKPVKPLPYVPTNP